RPPPATAAGAPRPRPPPTPPPPRRAPPTPRSVGVPTFAAFVPPCEIQRPPHQPRAVDPLQRPGGGGAGEDDGERDHGRSERPERERAREKAAEQRIDERDDLEPPAFADGDDSQRPLRQRLSKVARRVA